MDEARLSPETAAFGGRQLGATPLPDATPPERPARDIMTRQDTAATKKKHPACHQQPAPSLESILVTTYAQVPFVVSSR